MYHENAYSLSKIQVCNTILFIIVTVLYNRSPELLQVKQNCSYYALHCICSQIFLPQNVLELLPWTHGLLQGYPYQWVIAKVDVLW